VNITLLAADSGKLRFNVFFSLGREDIMIDGVVKKKKNKNSVPLIMAYLTNHSSHLICRFSQIILSGTEAVVTIQTEDPSSSLTEVLGRLPLLNMR
jgi:hypothetical protein